MPLEQGIAALVKGFIAAGRPSGNEQSIDDRRKGYVASTALAGDTETRVKIRDLDLEGMRFRMVSPLNATGPLPAVIYYHGGCFVSGGFATHDNQLRQMAYQGHCHVIAVQYRLAPEHGYPAAHNDAEAGANIVWRNASLLGIDAAGITLAGDSAGGHLALVTALRLKTVVQWQPAKLILIYPMLDTTASYASYIRNGEDYVITRDTLLSGYELYLGTLPRKHPEASPLWREDLDGLPPVHVITAEYDPLCDEGMAIQQRIQEQGGECSHKHYPGVIHGFFQPGGISDSTREVMKDVARQIVL